MELEEANQLALGLMAKHNLEAWCFKFINTKRKFGCCYYRQKTIGLSKELTLLNNKENVQDTILHEIAHALEPKAKHSFIWKQRCLEIGANPNRTYKTENVVMPKGRYQAICPVCGYIHKKFKRPNFKIVSSCGLCTKVFDKKYILDWKFVM